MYKGTATSEENNDNNNAPVKQKHSGSTADVHQYIVEKTMKENSILERLRKETLEMGRVSIMQISPDQGQFMKTMVQITKAKKIVEVGVFTGYSTLSMALGLPQSEGKIYALDISERWTNIGKKYWKEAGVQNKIDLKIAPAIESLQELKKTELGEIDLAFIDADKVSYDAYYESLLQLLKPGGVILLDNMIWGGKVIDNSIQDDDTVAIRNLNAKIAQDSRVTGSLLTLGDGVFVVTKH